MTQVLPASLVAPTQASLSADQVGYLIRTIAGVEGSFVSNTGTAGAISKVASTGYFYATTGITAPDDGGVLEWYINNAGVKSTFLSAVAIEPVPANFTDMAITATTGQVTVGTLANNVITANSINSGAITNTKFAAGAIDAAAIATDAVTEIQSGLATQASVDALPNAGTIADAVWDELLSSHTIAGSTGKKLADTSTLTAGDIPAGLTAQQVWEYATRALTGTQATNLANISNIPTNPLLTNDARLNNIDTTISSRSTLTAAQIRTELATELARLDVAVSTRLATAGYTTPPTTSQIATAVEAALLNDADGQALLAAIQTAVQALFDQQADIPVSTLVSLIAAQITADHGSGSYTTANVSALALEATVQAIRAKTDNLPASPAAVGDVPTTTQIWTHATRALTDKDNFNLAPNQAFSTTGSVDSVTDPVTVGALNNNVITDDAIAASAVTELQANLATQASVDALPNASAIADAVWDEPLSGHTSTGTTGKKLTDTSTLTVGDIPPGLSAADVWTHATRALTDKDNFGLADNAIDADTLATSAVTEIQNGLATASSISTPAQIASQVRTELATELARINVDLSTRLAAADYVAPDNTGILTAIGALPSASTIANSVWNATLSNYTGPGSTGAKLGLASTLTVGDIPAGLSAQQVWEYATRTLTTASGLTTEQNTKLNELWRKAGLDLATPVVRILNPATGNVTETLGTTTITHTESNSGNTVTSARQP
jgi:hypothetical protein